MTRQQRGLGLILALVLLSPATAHESPEAETPQTEAPHVVIISVDGLVPEYYLTPQRHGLRLPNLMRMKVEGAYADGMEGVYPSVTYPSHATMVSGVRPNRHGIIQNRIFEPPTATQTGAWYWFAEDLKGETLWGLARRSGMVTGAVGWPVTAGAEIDFNFPEIWDPSESPPTFRRAVQHSTPGLLRSALGEGLGRDLSTDARRTAVSEYIIREHRPRLMLVHLVELDMAHHRYGVGSRQAIETAERLDGYVGRIVETVVAAGIESRTTFLLVSDHGFAEVRRRFHPNVVLVREKLIIMGGGGVPVDWKAAAWTAGGACAIVLRDQADEETAAKVTQTFQLIARRGNSPINRVVTRPELDRLGAIPGALLVLDAGSGVVFGDAYTGSELEDARDYHGTHGQLPSRPEMRAALVIHGAAARKGARIGLARMIDVAPTAAALLGVRFEDIEGLPMTELVRLPASAAVTGNRD